MLVGFRLNKFILLFMLIALLLSYRIEAAGPVTHAYLAKKWILYHEKFNASQEASFIRGTLFPDIRYLGVITRDKTHAKNLTLPLVLNGKNPFLRGKDLHAWVDEEREKFVIKMKMYQKLKSVPGQAYISTFLKLLEDEFFYKKASWTEIKSYLRVIDKQEKKYKINQTHLLKWHNVLIQCFSMPPSQYLQKLVKENKGFANVPPSIVKKWQVILPTFSKRADVRQYVAKLDNYFDKVFLDQKEQDVALEDYPKLLTDGSHTLEKCHEIAEEAFQRPDLNMISNMFISDAQKSCMKKAMEHEHSKRLSALKGKDEVQLKIEENVQQLFMQASDAICLQECQVESWVPTHYARISESRCLVDAYAYRAFQLRLININKLNFSSAPGFIAHNYEDSREKMVEEYGPFVSTLCKLPASVWEESGVPINCRKIFMDQLNKFNFTTSICY